MARLRLTLIFVCAFLTLGAIAGKNLWRASPDNHFVHLASGWLDGRLSLPGRPPHGNDWGRVTTLTLRDGRQLRGFPCRTEACRASTKTEGVEIWQPLGEDWVKIPRPEIVKRRHTYYVTFPPGPAAIMLPFVALWGFSFLDVLFTVFLGALIPAALVSFLDGIRGRDGPAGREHLWAAAALTIGSPLCFVASNGSVWLTAQTLAVLLSILALADGWEFRRPIRAGAWLAVLVATRPTAAMAIGLFLLHQWFTHGRRPKAAVLAATPVLVAGVALMWLNVVRFDSVFEFGHRYLDIAWQPRMQEHGMFSLTYLGRNLHAMLALLPKSTADGLRISVHGVSLLLVSPWLLAWPTARGRFPQRNILLAVVLAGALPGLLYQNTGQIQFSYRFALDWLAPAVVAMTLGGGFARRWQQALIGAAVVANVWGAWLYAHAKGKLFVKGLWPYGSA